MAFELVPYARRLLGGQGRRRPRDVASPPASTTEEVAAEDAGPVDQLHVLQQQRLTGVPSAAAHQRLAVRLLHTGEVNAATLVAQAGLLEHPGDRALTQLVMQAQEANEDLAHAARTAHRLLEIDPSNSEAQRILLRARLGMGANAAAQAAPGRSRAAPPRNASELAPISTEHASISGHVESLPVPDLFELLAARRMTGILRIDAPTAVFFGWFLDGAIAWLMALRAPSSPAEPKTSALGLVPIPTGRASAEEFRTVLRMVASWLEARSSHDKHREYILFDEVTSVLLSAIVLSEAAFSFQVVPAPGGAAAVVDSRAALLEAHRRLDETRRRA